VAETIVADPAWPGLVAAVAAADPRRWRAVDLLRVAAEHLRDADTHQPIRPDEYARLLTYSIDLFTIESPYGREVPSPDEPPLSPDEHEEIQRRFPDPHPEAAVAQAPDIDIPIDSAGLAPPDPHGCNYTDELGALQFEELPARRPEHPELQPALADVRALRRQVAQARDRLHVLEADVRESHDPAMRAAMPRIRELRNRAAADRPHLLAIQEILAQWTDADEVYIATLRQIRWAVGQVDRLRASGADELDVASAEADLRVRRMTLPDASPAERFYKAFTEAVTARVEAAGGADRIVTDDDVDAVIAEATTIDQATLQATRARLGRLTEELDRAEATAAAAFAAAETRSAEHRLAQQDMMRTELAVLEAAGGFDPNRAMELPPTATDHLPDATARALRQLASTPFTLTPVYAADRPDTLQAMRVLYAAAAACGRNVLWCSGTEHLADAEIADTVVAAADAHRLLMDGSWRLPTDSLVVIDNASAVESGTIADIAARAAEGNSAVILMDGDEGRWPPGPSGALMRLLQEDLPWAVTLNVSDAAVQRHPRRPDFDAALVQAHRAAPRARTTEIDDAVARREELRAKHRSAYRVHAAWTRDSGRDWRRDDERDRGV
jgi:hypothetical protein